MKDITNKAFQLGEEYPERKLVHKVMRSFPTRFSAKVAAIEEAKYI